MIADKLIQVASSQLYKLVPEIVRHFDIDIVDKAKPWNVQIYW